MDSEDYYLKNCYLLPFSLSVDNELRSDEIISTILKVNPYIIALQEVWPNSFVKKIKRALSDYSFIGGEGTFINQGGLLTGIKEKNIMATRYAFPQTREWSQVEKWGCKSYDILTLSKNARLINTHLYAPTNKAEESITRMQFALLCSILRSRGGILVGDLNIEQSDFLKINNLFRYTPTNQFTLCKENKYANLGFNKTPFSKKIDYALGTHGFYVTEKILTHEDSDHYALTGSIQY